MQFAGLGGLFASLLLGGSAAALAQVPSQPTSQPAVQLERIGQFGGTAQALAARDDFAVLGLGPSLLILERQDRDLIIRATLPIGLAARDIALVGDRAWIATGGPELLGVDITKINAPRIVQRVPLPGARRITASDDLLLVGLAESAVAVLSLEPNKSPRVVGRLALRAEPLSLAIAGDLACAALGDAGVVFVRLAHSNPPQLLANFHAPGAVGVAIASNRAFVALRERGMHVLDISDPANPRAATYLPLKNPAEHVAVCGETVYAALSQGGLLRLQLNRVDNWEPHADQDPGNALARLISTGPPLWALTSTATPRVHVYRRAAEDRDLKSVAELSLLGRAVSLAVVGERAYVADLNDRLKIIDIRDPARPQQLGTLACDRSAEFCRTDGTLLVVGGGPIELFTTAGDLPRRQGEYSTPGLIFDARPLRAGQWLTVGSQLARPGMEGTIRQPDGTTRRLSPHGPGLLHVVDLADPAAPRTLGQLELRAIGRMAAVAGDFAYVADQNGGLNVVDVSDPAAPKLAGYFHTQRELRGIAVLREQVILADANRGALLVVDVSTPTSPRFRMEIPLAEPASALAVLGRFLAVAEGAKAIRLLAPDSTEPWSTVARVPAAGAAADVAAGGNLLWIADRTAGLVAYGIR